MENGEEDIVAQYFYKGAKVEISSKDEGFQGSWYVGTVLSHRKSKRNSCMKVLVKYKTLLDSEGTRRIRKEVDAIQLRPSPPPENRRMFESSENVDAYYLGGWWHGVITEVLGENKYSVFFRDSREQRNFKASRLRRHHEWVIRKWVPPFEQGYDVSPPLKRPKVEKVSPSTKVKSKKRTIENNFSPRAPIEVNGDEDGFEDASFDATAVKKSGALKVSTATKVKPKKEILAHYFRPGEPIEVCSDDEGFEGAWFPATIVRKLDRGYLIEYQNLRNENDTEFLREEADTLHIRPCPPNIELLDRFEVLDKVEALHDDIWWVGVISKVRTYDEYNVYFRSFDEELRFNQSRLRPHQNWINRKWVFLWGSTWVFLFSSIAAYVVVSIFLHLLLLLVLRHRRALPLGPIPAVHSLSMALISITIFTGILLSTAAEIRDTRWFWHRSRTTPFQWLLCFPLGTRPSGRVFFWSYIYYLSRFLHAVRTFFTILRGRRLSFFKLFNNSILIFMSFLWLEFSQSFQVVAILLTTLVYSVVYGYRFWTAIGLRSACFPFVVNCQMVLLSCNLLCHVGVLLLHFIKGGCNGIGAWVFNSVLNGAILFLFLKFYVQMHLQKRKAGGDGGDHRFAAAKEAENLELVKDTDI